MPYRLWAKDGFLELCEAFEGACIDLDEVQARIEWGADHFDLQELCYDPWNFRQMLSRLDNKGITCVEIRQGYATLSLPSKKLLELVKTGKLYHGGHPVLKWNAACLSTKEVNDNLMFKKPERSKSSLRIDGIAASVNALCRAMLGESEEAKYQVMIF
jgi:phage terminase large subunit-like protein